MVISDSDPYRGLPNIQYNWEETAGAPCSRVTNRKDGFGVLLAAQLVMKRMILLVCLVLGINTSFAQSLEYPYPVQHMGLVIEGKPVQMAYMDVRPEKANGKSVLLLHGKNFNGYYWKGVIQFLKKAGYRVVVPDQVGWGKSDKPDIHYSFHLLAYNTKKLIDSLQITRIHVIGHSLGGMLATRFTLMYPETVERLLLENPIGLEDYKTFVPYQTVDVQFANELKTDYNSLKKYQQTYYPLWKPEYEQYVQAQWDALQAPDFKSAIWTSALTYQMIYEQPVYYEFKYVKASTLLIIGQEDRTVVGKNLLPPAVAAKHGHYPRLGNWLQAQIKTSRLLPLPGVGHIPHIQAPATFKTEVLKFLKQ